MATRTKRAGKKAAARAVQPIPRGYPAITPYLRVRGADRALGFYRKAFGARAKDRMVDAGGRIMHAELQVLNTVVMLSDEFPERGALSPESLKGSPVSLFVYTRDVDAVIARAVAAGATVTMPAQDMFWGDRFGTIRDPFGHEWHFATHKEDVTPREMQRRFQAMLAQPGGGPTAS